MNVNWSIIKEKYANAYMHLLDEEDLSESSSTRNLYDPETDSEYNIRKLYDFFDAREIECFIIPGAEGFEKIPLILNSYRGPSFESRQEAEVDLFTKAFQLLEQQLSSPVVSFMK